VINKLTFKQVVDLSEKILNGVKGGTKDDVFLSASSKVNFNNAITKGLKDFVSSSIIQLLRAFWEEDYSSYIELIKGTKTLSNNNHCLRLNDIIEWLESSCINNNIRCNKNELYYSIFTCLIYLARNCLGVCSVYYDDANGSMYFGIRRGEEVYKTLVNSFFPATFTDGKEKDFYLTISMARLICELRSIYYCQCDFDDEQDKAKCSDIARSFFAKNNNEIFCCKAGDVNVFNKIFTESIIDFFNDKYLRANAYCYYKQDTPSNDSIKKELSNKVNKLINEFDILLNSRTN
jgi:hypothetical protein